MGRRWSLGKPGGKAVLGGKGLAKGDERSRRRVRS